MKNKFTTIILGLLLILIAKMALGEYVKPDPGNILAEDRTEWGIGRLVFAKWEKGCDYPSGMRVLDSSGTLRAKAPDHWDLQIDETVEIGLRADGVLVWRKADNKTE